MTTKKSKKKKTEKPYYVNGKEFTAAIKDYYAEDTDIIPDQLAIYVKKIADGLSYAPNFINYSGKMLSLFLIKVWKSKKVFFNSSFAYSNIWSS